LIEGVNFFLFREDIDELISNESLDVIHKLRGDAFDTTLTEKYKNETKPNREMLMDIAIR